MATLMERWVEMLRDTELPVLARTVAEIEALRRNSDNASPQRLAAVVLHDPFMTVKVLRYLQTHRSRRRSADITTIAHALMMLGSGPFFEHFRSPETLEHKFTGASAAQAGALAVMGRARHAALYAYDWAQRRHDIDPEEVMVAALLHDLAEMLLWCFAPELALEIADRQLEDRALRSEAAQIDVIGFRLLDLQLAMIKAWQLPDLLHVLLNEEQTNNHRVLNVAQAAALARHLAHGWDNLALPHDYAMIGRLLSLGASDAERYVHAVAKQAASEDDWYGIVTPAPPLPQDSEVSEAL